MLKGRKRKRKLAVKNGDVDETVESETGSGSVTTSSDLASPAKVTHCVCFVTCVWCYFSCRLHLTGNYSRSVLSVLLIYIYY